MLKKISLLLLVGLLAKNELIAQKAISDKIVDTTIADYDLLFNELNALMDSLMTPKSFILFDIGVGNRYYNFGSKSSYLLESSNKITYTPSISYFDKSGFGFMSSAIVLNDGQHINPYQFNLTSSYDYTRNASFISGIAFTHYFTKDSLPFYTSPLNNELFLYIASKKFWLKPAISLSYGWGTRSDYTNSESYISSRELPGSAYTTINTKESINDLNISISLRHDFYWINVLSSNDYIRLTPQIVYTSGTMQFGFNQISNSYSAIPRTNISVISSTDNLTLENHLNYQPLAASGYFKVEYSKGNIFLQPQLIVEYYFPAMEKKLNTAFLINAGVIF